MMFVELRPSMYKSKVVKPGETVYELTSGPGSGVAIADIIKSEPHVHYQTTETYFGIGGDLEVILDGQSHILRPGGRLVIRPGVRHQAQSLDRNRARVLVFSFSA